MIATARNMARLALVLCCIAMLTGCLSRDRFGKPGSLLQRRGDEIVICGELFHTGAPVVLWMDPCGFDAYRVEPRFATSQPSTSSESTTTASAAASRPTGARYGSMRRHVSADVMRRVEAQGWSRDFLRPHVTQIVLHYDACGTSRRCFEVLHDIRGLSAHFLLDIDGTIYQTLDVKERAWHAGEANDRSIGIEIANIGAYEDESPLSEWFMERFDIENPGVRSNPSVTVCVSPPPPKKGLVQGRQLMQYDFTEAQYASLAKLVATLCIALPEIRVDYPRDAGGALIRKKLSDEQIRDFRGLIGHFHVSENKVDPGPAFDWERLVRGVRKWLR